MASLIFGNIVLLVMGNGKKTHRIIIGIVIQGAAVDTEVAHADGAAANREFTAGDGI